MGRGQGRQGPPPQLSTTDIADVVRDVPALRPDTYKGIWDAIANTPEQAANLRARSDLMRAIAQIVASHG